MKNTYKKLTFLFLIILIPNADADVKSIRTNSIDGFFNGFNIEAGATFTALSTDEPNVNNEYFNSFDFAASLPTTQGEWVVYLEGNTTPRVNGVNEVIVGANADVGSSLDSDGKGRLQLSELHYSWQQFSGTLTAGLVDLSGFIDSSEIANDENSQFLSSNFTNNPTIAFPDYTIGMGYLYAPENENWGVTTLFAGSNGIADNNKRTYSQLFKLDGEGKGAFTAVEGFYVLDDALLKLGAWHSSADFNLLTNNEKTDSNYGLYGSVEGVLEQFTWNIRVGFANEDVSAIAQFTSIAVELPFQNNTLGVAVAKSWVSSKLPDNQIDNLSEGTYEDSQQIELYYRMKLPKNIDVTPSVQFIENSNFNSELASVWVYGVRLNWVM